MIILGHWKKACLINLIISTIDNLNQSTTNPAANKFHILVRVQNIQWVLRIEYKRRGRFSPYHPKKNISRALQGSSYIRVMQLVIPIYQTDRTLVQKGTVLSESLCHRNCDSQSRYEFIIESQRRTVMKGMECKTVNYVADIGIEPSALKELQIDRQTDRCRHS